VVVWLVGLGSVFSFNLWSEFRPLGMFPVFADKNFFDVLDFITSNVMLPLGGLLIAVFAAWRLSRSTSFDELKMGDGLAYPLWRFLVRYITPIAVLIVFLDALGILPDF
jgi:NSS family neurotransmitter:Na+ symporter